MIKRCNWAGHSELLKKYHDEEWGVPLHDDQKLFEFMVLDAFQAGLSWSTILNKREGFRKAFDDFDANLIAKYSDVKVDALLKDESIIRNRQKILATIKNAKAFLRLQKAFGSFDQYIWQFTDHKTIKNHFTEIDQLPVTSPESVAMSKALKKEGFSFVGPTICYAFMQAAGMVNDHMSYCHRH